MADPLRISTERLRLRCFTNSDRDDFARLNADTEVMHDLGGPIDREASDRKLDTYIACFDHHGYSRWAVEAPSETCDGSYEFIGYTGIVAHRDTDHPLGSHDEIGWRLMRSAWGRGYATEAATAALADGFSRVGLRVVLSYTAADNHRSQGVMRRLNLVRDPSLDFTARYPGVGDWTGLVWTATTPLFRSSSG